MKPVQLICVSLLCSTLFPGMAAAAQLNSMRCGLQPDGAYRLVLDFDEPPRHELVSSDDGMTQQIKLQGARLDDAKPPIGCDPARIVDVAATASGTADAMLRVRLRTAMNAKLFYLRPFAGRGHRLALDLTPVPAEPSAAAGAPVSAAAIPDATRQEAEIATVDDAAPLSSRARVSPPVPARAPPESSERARGEWRVRGYVGAEARGFLQSAQFPQQKGSGLSLVAEPEFFRVWQDDSLSFRPFVRWDQHDSRRTHADVRELLWTHAGDGWELAAGVGKVFWGVTEAYHLVDIINQTDLVENPDGEQKLGQQMIKVASENDWGTVSLFALPGFRERTYPGVNGRLRPGMVVDTDNPVYLDDRTRWNWDWALRWSHYIDDLDIALAHFHGTGREPTLVPNGGLLTPVYERIDQTSLEAQFTRGDWLWKFEGLRRSGQGTPFWASTAGFEYTLVGVADSAADLGLLTEVMYDSRGNAATTPFNRDVFLGLRWTANDVSGSELLVGVITDWDSSAKVFNLEASRRFGQNWKLQVQARGWFDIPATDPLAGYQDDDYIETTLFRYF
jgi:hypothetical protein